MGVRYGYLRTKSVRYPYIATQGSSARTACFKIFVPSFRVVSISDRMIYLMRPAIIHVIILAGFCIIGFALLTMEALTPQLPGGLIKQYTFTKLYWLALGFYSLITTTVVLSVGIYYRIKDKPLTGKSVVLSHVIPVALVWLSIHFGLHDRMQDAWKNKTHGIESIHKQPQAGPEEHGSRPIPSAPLHDIDEYQAPDTIIEPAEQQGR
jgi:hypothetical protein